MPQPNEAATAAREGGRGETIYLRASQKQKAIVDRAAEVLGRSRSEFMLEAACREAETVFLNCRYFEPSPDAFKPFTAMLDRPATNKISRVPSSEIPSTTITSLPSAGRSWPRIDHTQASIWGLLFRPGTTTESIGSFAYKHRDNLKLVSHMMTWSRRSHDAIGVRTLRKGSMHGILTHQTHDQTHRCNKQIIDNPQ
ncbi:MAG: DUF1778 domain-containing protein [Nitrospira sp. LK70]|nr:DUF1778 domain-containing protein [Nitrospira sp. LK70]